MNIYTQSAKNLSDHFGLPFDETIDWEQDIDHEPINGTIEPWNKGIPHTKETKKLISEKAIGRKVSDETKRKISENNAKYWKGKTHSEKSKKKMSENSMGKKNGMYGRKQTEEAKEKVGRSKLGVPRPKHVCEAISKAIKLRPKKTCPHCNKTLDQLNYSKWHGDSCRYK